MLPEGMSQIFRLLYLGTGWVDCVAIWHALGDPLVTAYAIKSRVGYLCTCARAPHLRISGSEWPIVLKFDVWLETQ